MKGAPILSFRQFLNREKFAKLSETSNVSGMIYSIGLELLTTFKGAKMYAGKLTKIVDFETALKSNKSKKTEEAKLTKEEIERLFKKVDMMKGK